MGAMIYFRVLCLSKPEICHHLWGVAISRSFSWYSTCEGHTVCELCHGCYLYTGHKKLVWKSPDLLDDLECHHTQLELSPLQDKFSENICSLQKNTCHYISF